MNSRGGFLILKYWDKIPHPLTSWATLYIVVSKNLPNIANIFMFGIEKLESLKIRIREEQHWQICPLALQSTKILSTHWPMVVHRLLRKYNCEKANVTAAFWCKVWRRQLKKTDHEISFVLFSLLIIIKQTFGHYPVIWKYFSAINMLRSTHTHTLTCSPES